jgi:hypothetical protein
VIFIVLFAYPLLTACDQDVLFPVETTEVKDASHSGSVSIETPQGEFATSVVQVTPQPSTEVEDGPISVLSLSAAEEFGLTELGEFSFLSSSDDVAVLFEDGIAIFNASATVPGEVLDSPSPQMLDVSQEADTVAWVSNDNTVYLWNPELQTSPSSLGPEPAPITSLAVAPQGDHLAYATYDSKIKVWNAGEEGSPEMWEAPTWLSNLSYSPDGTSLGGADLANFLYFIFDTDNGETIRTLEWTESNSPNLYGAYISPDWVNLAWVARSSVQLMNIATGSLGPLLNHEDYISALAWSPEGNVLATAAAATVDGQFSPVVILWDIKTGMVLRTLAQETPVQSLEFSPEGLNLGVMGVNGELKIWPTE